MTSTPAARSSSAIFGVMPRPPATFSPLTTTNGGAWRSRSAGSSPSSVRRPRPPTRSPTKRMVAGASGTAHTFAHRTDERTGGQDRPAAAGAAGDGRAGPPAGRAAGRRAALGPARRPDPRRPRGLRDRYGGRGGSAAVSPRGDHRADPQPGRGDAPAGAGAARPGDPRRLRRLLRDARVRWHAARQPD